MHAGAGNDQITDSRQSAKGLELTAHSGSQPGNLGNSPRDQRGLRVVSVSQSIRNTGGQGDDILKRSAQFDSLHIRAGVDAERLTHEDGLDVLRSLFAVGACDAGGGKPLAHLFRVAGSRQNRDIRHGKLLLQNLGKRFKRRFLNSLCHIYNNLSFSAVRLHLLCRGADIDGRNGGNQHVLILHDLLQAFRKHHPIRKNQIRQSVMAPSRLHLRNFLRQRRPYGYVMTVVIQENSQSDSPAS